MKKYAFLPGALMTVVAVVWAWYTARWDETPTALIAGGLLALAIGVVVNWAAIRDWFRDPRGIFAINTILSTLLLIAILVLVNAAVALRPLKYDWTSSGRNTLSSEAGEILRKLTTDVTLKQFGRSPDPRTSDLLASFAQQNPRVSAVFVDAEKSIQETKRYSVLKNGTVVVEAGGKHRKVEQVTEPALVTAVLQVTSKHEPVVCFSAGNGEHGMEDESASGVAMLAQVLTASNHKVQRISLLQDTPPQPCNAVVIAGVPNGLPADVLKGMLVALVNGGGRLALLVDPPADPALAAWVSHFGITIGQGLVIDNSPQGQAVGAGPESPLATGYTTHPIARGFGLGTLYSRAAALTVAKSADFGVPAPLAATGSRSFERVDLLSRSTQFTEGRDRPGPITLAAVSRLSKGPAFPPETEGRLVVFGDSDWVTNALIGQQGNRDLALRAVAWLAGEEDARIVSVSDRENRRISMTESTRVVLYLVCLGLLPLIPLVAGIVQFVRSRR